MKNLGNVLQTVRKIVNFINNEEENGGLWLPNIQRYFVWNEEQMENLIKKLSHILMGEMEPYYVMRYGFYEGHTSYRADPIAIAFIFGLKSLEEIENAFQGNLYRALTKHFTRENF